MRPAQNRSKVSVMNEPISPPPGFEKLPIEEKIAYVQALWDLIVESPEDIPVPEWQRAVLDERLTEARSTVANARPWSEVRAELRGKLRAVQG